MYTSKLLLLALLGSSAALSTRPCLLASRNPTKPLPPDEREAPPPASAYSDSNLPMPIAFRTIAAVATAALLYDAANPAFGERRLQRLLEREAAAEQLAAAARAAKSELANAQSRAARERLHASVEAALAEKERRRRDAAASRSACSCSTPNMPASKSRE